MPIQRRMTVLSRPRGKREERRAHRPAPRALVSGILQRSAQARAPHSGARASGSHSQTQVVRCKIMRMLWVFLAMMLCACASPGGPVRSPALDYEPPAPTTADGDTVGADRTGPGDKLHQGVTTTAPAPGWSADKSGLTFDPNRRKGGAIDPVPANGSSSK